MKHHPLLLLLQCCAWCTIVFVCSPAMGQDSCMPVTFQSVLSNNSVSLSAAGIAPGTIQEGYAIAGKTGTGNYHPWLMVAGKKADPKWSLSPGLDSAFFSTVITTGDGHYLALGNTGSVYFKTRSYLLAKFDTSGNMEWCKRYFRSGLMTGSVLSAITTYDGGIVFYSDSGTVVKTDGNGNLLWARAIKSLLPDNTPAPALIQYGDTLLLADNGFAIGGTATYLFKLSATDGRMLSATLMGSANILRLPAVRSLSKKGDRYYINCFSPNPSVSRSDPTLFVYDTTGRLLSLRKYYITEVLLSYSSTVFATAAGEWGAFTVLPGISNLYAYRLPLQGGTAAGNIYPVNSNTLSMISTDDNGFLSIGNTGSDGGMQTVRLIKTDSSGKTPGCSSTLASLNAEDVNIQMTVVSFPSPASESYQQENLSPVITPVAVTKTQLCVDNSCTSLKITGFDSICLLNSPVPYGVQKNVHCFSPVQWSVDDASVQLRDATDSTVNMVFAKKGSFMLHARMISGCSVIADSLLVRVNVSPALDLGPDIQLCRAGAIRLSAGPGFKGYHWQDGSSDSTFIAPGVGQYSITVEDYCGSILHDTVNITHGGDIPFDMGPDLQKCNGDSLLLQAPTGFSRYNWLPAYNMRLMSPDRVQVWPAKDTAYTVIAYTSTGCLFMDTVAVTVFHSPAIASGPDTSLCTGQTVLLKAPAGFVQYTWQDGSTGSGFSAGKRGVYWVNATDSNHCSIVDTILVSSSTTCKTGLYFPNAFTPDGSSNNVWRPVLTDGVLTAFRLLIYNRYGQKIFESSDPQNGWNGSWQGKQQPSGAFAWVCSWQFAGQPAQTGKGSFLLLR